MFRTQSRLAVPFGRGLRLLIVGLLTAAVTAALASAVAADPTADEVINFSTGDPATDPATEGIAVAADGTIYVSANTGDGGQIWTVAPGADTPEVLATLIPPTGGAGFGVLGLHFDGDDLLAAAHTLADPELNGVWRIDTSTGEAGHIAGTEAILLPNDITTWGGKIYVTDSVTGGVWVIDGDGAQVSVEPFIVDDLLAGLGVLVPGVPIGANGIDAHGGKLYIANLEKGLVVAAQINGNSARSQPTVVATLGGAVDGLEVDRQGRPHVVLIDRAALVRVNRDGSSTTLIESTDVLDAPASLAFGQRSDKSSIYVVNFSIGEGFPDVIAQSDVGPSVVRFG